MKNGYNQLEQIQNLLQTAPRGLTIIEISHKLGFSRNSTAKYMEMLLIAGKVELRKFGRSKIYLLSNKVAAATILSFSSDLVVFIDAGLKIIDVNDQFLRFEGLSRAQIVGYTLEEINVDLLLHRDILLNIKDGLQGREVIKEIRMSKGREEHYFKMKMLPIETGTNQWQIALIFEDISVRKKAEIALKESEARYRAVVEDQTELISRMAPDMTITFVNEAWCKFFQVDRETVLGKKHSDLVRFTALPQRRQILESIKVKKPTVTLELDIRIPGGQIRWINATCRGIFDSAGRLHELQIVARDITDQKQAELALKQSEVRYLAIVNNQQDLVSLHAPDTTVTFSNEAFQRFWGLPKEELIGMKLSDLFSPDEYRKVKARMDRIGPGKVHMPFEDIEITRQGSTFWFQWSCTGIFDDRGVLIEYQLVAHDITERKQAEIASTDSLEKVQAIIDQSPNALCTVSMDFRCLRVNIELSHLTGYSEQELLSETAAHITGMNYPGETESSRDLEAGRISQYQVEKRCSRKDASSIKLRKKVRLVRGVSGKPELYLCMFAEVSVNQ